MIRVDEVEEQEDGSAIIRFDLDEADKAVLIEEGMKYLLFKAAYNVTDNQLAEILESAKAS
jgi:hypothetical protein